MRRIAHVPLAASIWCAALIVWLVVGGPRPPMTVALVPPIAVAAVMMLVVFTYTAALLTRAGVESRDIDRARSLAAVPHPWGVILLLGIVGFFIVTVVSIAGAGHGQMRRVEVGLVALAGGVSTITGAAALGLHHVDVEVRRRAFDQRAQAYAWQDVRRSRTRHLRQCRMCGTLLVEDSAQAADDRYRQHAATRHGQDVGHHPGPATR